MQEYKKQECVIDKSQIVFDMEKKVTNVISIKNDQL